MVALPPIPSKRYFTIGEVSVLCALKQHVLRYWEQEFSQLKPTKRGGNRRYYQYHEVLLIRRIRELLYDQGFTINGARNRLNAMASGELKESVKCSENELMQDMPIVLAYDAHIDTGRLRTALLSVLHILQN
ncbi:MAG: MerR family transcriptional regulator [Ottowia sp.]|nr:MerR family transcriptional regulator [Ottowia sp.]